jgi:DNA-binding FadR family transcriptional regulator
MADMTKREQVWTYVLLMTHRKGESVHHTDVADHVGVTRKTAREALHAMADSSFIVRKLRNRKTVYVAPQDGI